MVLRNGIGMLLFLAAEPCFLLVASAFVLVAPAVAGQVVSSSSSSLRVGMDSNSAARDGVAATNACTSNTTHCGWIDNTGKGTFEKMDEARAQMTQYLWQNIMPVDVPRARTLGFDPDMFMALDESENNKDKHESTIVERIMKEQSSVDGLSDGILNQTLHYSLKAKALYPWTDSIPKDIYMEYVVPYAVTNEPRSDHRPLLFDALKDTLKNYERSEFDMLEEYDAQSPGGQIKEVTKLINTRLWAILGRPSKPIAFKAGLTPRIYDPLSVIAYGHSSCTGLAVVLVAALRAVGIPARMAGTPAWYGDPDKGNHSWVEVWVPDNNNNGEGKWIFLEPTPGIAEGDEDTADADDLDRDPCKRWFCTSERFNGSTKVYATRFDKENASNFYPMAWSVGDEGVPGEDRSEYYTNICGKCQH